MASDLASGILPAPDPSELPPPTYAMVEAEAFAVIQLVVRTELRIPRTLIREDTLLGDVGLDSIGLVTLAVGLEDQFRVLLREEDHAVTVGDLAALVAERATSTLH